MAGRRSRWPVPDIPVQRRRDNQAAKTFFHNFLKGLTYGSRVIITDQLKRHGAALRELLPGAEHRQHRRKTPTDQHASGNDGCSGSSRPGTPGASSPRMGPLRRISVPGATPSARVYRLQMTPRFQRCSVEDVSPRSCSSCKRSHWLTNHCYRFRPLGHRRRHGPGLDPVPCGNVGHTHPPCEQELFDITVAEAEPEIEPDAMTDHLSQEAVVLVRVRRWCTDASRLAHQAALNKPRNKLIMPWDPRVHHGESPKASLALRVGNFEGEG
jgi:hypothetical protein